MIGIRGIYREKMQKGKNVFEDYAGIVGACREAGLEPVLFLDSASTTLIRAIKKRAVVDRYFPAGMEIVSCSSAQKGGAMLTSGFVCAKDEGDAMRAFRLRRSLEVKIGSAIGRGRVGARIFGVDAVGNVYNSGAVPLFGLKSTSETELQTIIDRINGELYPSAMGYVDGVIYGEHDARLIFCLRNIDTPIAQVDGVRKVMLNTVWKELVAEYDLEPLDDRAGMDSRNIRAYLRESSKRIYAKKKLDSICGARDESIAGAGAYRVSPSIENTNIAKNTRDSEVMGR